MSYFKSFSRMFGADSPPSGPDGYRAYAIGDVHGRLDLLDEMMDAVEHDIEGREPKETVLVFLGDLYHRDHERVVVFDAEHFRRVLFLH